MLNKICIVHLLHLIVPVTVTVCDLSYYAIKKNCIPGFYRAVTIMNAE